MDNKTLINTYLSFMIDNEYFAVNVSKVLEVILKPKITRVPNVADDIKGVINFRGEIIPVFETRIRFGLPERNMDEKFVIIIFEIEKNENITTIGAIVDKVKDVVTISENQILAVPKMSSKFKEELITGIIKLDEDYVMMLNLDKMFSDSEITVLNEITQTVE